MRTTGRLIAVLFAGLLGCSPGNVVLGGDRAIAGTTAAPPIPIRNPPAPPEDVPVGGNGVAGSAAGTAGSAAMDAGSSVPMDAMAMTPSDAAGPRMDADMGATPVADAGDSCELPIEIIPVEMKDCSALLCRSASRFEIRVTSSTPWYMGTLFWTLVLCRSGIVRSESSPDARVLVFVLTDGELAALRGLVPVTMFYGSYAGWSQHAPEAGIMTHAAECGLVDTTQVPDCPAL